MYIYIYICICVLDAELLGHHLALGVGVGQGLLVLSLALRGDLEVRLDCFLVRGAFEHGRADYELPGKVTRGLPWVTVDCRRS